MEVDADVEADIVRFKDLTFQSTFSRLLAWCAGVALCLAGLYFLFGPDSQRLSAEMAMSFVAVGAVLLAVGAICFPERSVEVDFVQREVRIAPGPRLGMAFLGASPILRWDFESLRDARYFYREGGPDKPTVRGIDLRASDGRPFRVAHTTNPGRYPKLERLAERLHAAITNKPGA